MSGVLHVYGLPRVEERRLGKVDRVIFSFWCIHLDWCEGRNEQGQGGSNAILGGRAKPPLDIGDVARGGSCRAFGRVHRRVVSVL